MRVGYPTTPVVMDIRSIAGDHGVARDITRSPAFLEGEPQKYHLAEKRQELKTCYPSENLGVIGKVSVESDKLSIKFGLGSFGLRFLLAVSGVLGGLGFAFLSGDYFYDNRQLLGAALVCGGCLLGLLGLLLALFPFPVSWRIAL